MWIDGLSLELGGSFSDEDAGWYDFDLTCDRPDLLSISTDGRLSVDEGMLTLSSSSISLSVSSDTAHHLPPLLQRIVNDHELAVQGVALLQVNLSACLEEVWQSLHDGLTDEGLIHTLVRVGKDANLHSASKCCVEKLVHTWKR